MTPDEACAHPNWVMGRKISVDSATMMNKALEVIEARWLFDLQPEQIRVVIHPQSIIHSMVVCRDGCVLAQLGTPDMRGPISYGLSFPQRIESGAARLDFRTLAALTFEDADAQRFPGLHLSWAALRGPEGSTTVLNAANEVAVAAFLDRQIGFDAIHRINAETIAAVLPQLGQAAAARRPAGAGRARPRACAAACAGAGAMITTVLAFLVTLAILVVVHEYGHYRVAVACGVKVLRFSVGFGRVLWRRQSGPEATEFVVSALPLGGYVRMLDEREAPVPPEELHRAFNRQTLWRRAAIVIAGPAANLLLAVLLFAAAQWLGTEEPRAVISAPLPASVAEQAGLRSGDWVRAVSRDGNDWTDVRSMNDLRWQITQAVLDGEPLAAVCRRPPRRQQPHRQARPAAPGHARCRCHADAPGGTGRAVQRAGHGRGQGRRTGRPGRAARRRPRARVDGQPVADAQGLRERIRQSVRGGAARADAAGRSIATAASSTSRCCRAWSTTTARASAASMPSSASRSRW